MLTDSRGRLGVNKYNTLGDSGEAWPHRAKGITKL